VFPKSTNQNMNPYHEFVAALVRLTEDGKRLPLGGIDTPFRSPTDADAPAALIFSPHPDDECIIGGLALRLLREAGMRIINVAVTLGSHRERQSARWQELKDACDWLGFDVESTGPHGLERVNLNTRQHEPAHWESSVKVIASILAKNQPRALFFPHESDWNSTHIGTHFLVMDALKTLPPDFECFLIETEFWRSMETPNLMVESSVGDAAELVGALSFHVGEMKRNDYHLRLPAWLQDNVRRGAEVVGGQGGEAPDFALATLYKISRWQRGRQEDVPLNQRQIGIKDDPAKIFG
jgi:LmbE family N-acetylglucosaminyl deacetylase